MGKAIIKEGTVWLLKRGNKYLTRHNTFEKVLPGNARWFYAVEQAMETATLWEGFNLEIVQLEYKIRVT